MQLFVFMAREPPQWARASSFTRFFYITHNGDHNRKTPLYEWLARHRDLYLKTYNTHNRQTSMPPVGLELTISAGERPQTYALDRVATGTSRYAIAALLLTLNGHATWIRQVVEVTDVYNTVIRVCLRWRNGILQPQVLRPSRLIQMRATWWFQLYWAILMLVNCLIFLVWMCIFV